MRAANRRLKRRGRGGGTTARERAGRARSARSRGAKDHRPSPARRPHQPLPRDAQGEAGGAGRGTAQTDRPREVPTIVEYSAVKRPVNEYPRRIISPPHPRACCASGMTTLGKPRREAGWFYVYKRCATCGFTVRSIVRRDPAAKLPAKATFN